MQRRFAFIGHALAYNISKSHPDASFCGVVQVRSSYEYLKKQKDVAYTSLILDEDIHKKLFDEIIDEEYLAQLEKEYGRPNLWPYLYVDRVIMQQQLVREYPYDAPLLSHDDMRRKLQVTAKEIISFLDREKPDVVVISVIGCVAASLLYHIAKKRGIKTINVDMARIGKNVVFSEDYRIFSGVHERLPQLQAGDKSPQRENTILYLEKFRATPAPFHKASAPSYKKQAHRSANLRFLAPGHFFWSAYWHIKMLIKDIFRGKSDYTDIRLWWAIWDKLKRKARGLRGYEDMYTTPEPKRRFAFYPLHSEPEIALLLYAPFYTNQLEVIARTAQSLPFDMLLLVKEHPAMVGYRTRAYYKELLKIPNVRLIDPRTPSHVLIQRSELTLTITSTAGWESVILKRPVITFGDVFFNELPGVARCRGFEELPELIQKQLRDWSHDEGTLIHYISALLEEAVPVDYIDLWERSESPEIVMENDGIREMSRALAKKVGIAS